MVPVHAHIQVDKLIEYSRPIVQEAEVDHTATAMSERERNPLAIPEIVGLVGVFLDRRTYIDCLRVCSLWHEVLVSRIWTTVDLNRFLGPSLPKPENLLRFTRKLTLFADSLQKIPPTLHCPQLESLRLWSIGRDKASVEFIRRHQTLKSLSISLWDSWLTEDLLEVLEYCTKLESLSLELMNTTQTNTDWWLPLYNRILSMGMKNLRSLHISARGTQEEPPVNIAKEFLTTAMTSTMTTGSFSGISRSSPTIQELCLGGEDRAVSDKMCRTLIKIVRQCPELRRLEWFKGCNITMFSPSPLRLMADEIRSWSCEKEARGWIKLESLTAPQHFDFLLTDFKVVIEAMPRLTELDLTAGELDSAAWEVLKAQPGLLMRLKVLKLKECSVLDGRSIQDMLCSLPKLEVFAAESIKDIDILADDRAWVCSGLKDLKVSFLLKGDTPPSSSSPNDSPLSQSQNMILARLSQLTRLEKLDLNGHCWSYYWTPEMALELTVEKGLDQLRTLRSLKCITAPEVERDTAWWGSAEVDWMMMGHWPELTSTKGFMSYKDDQNCKRLNELLSENRAREWVSSVRRSRSERI